MTDEKKDIWIEGIKSIIASTKRSLLDFIDMIEPKTNEEKNNIGKIKGRVHNDLSAAYLGIGSLVALMKQGGDITPFEDTIIKKDNSHRDNNKK